jgi:hypothetical protein
MSDEASSLPRKEFLLPQFTKNCILNGFILLRAEPAVSVRDINFGNLMINGWV